MADDLAQTQEAIRFIGEMEKTEGWKHYSQRLEWKIDAERARLEAGGLKDLGEYKHHTGILQGMKYALTIRERLEDEAVKLREMKDASSK